MVYWGMFVVGRGRFVICRGRFVVHRFGFMVYRFWPVVYRFGFVINRFSFMVCWCRVDRAWSYRWDWEGLEVKERILGEGSYNAQRVEGNKKLKTKLN